MRNPPAGNIRELESILEQALAESPRGHIRMPASLAAGARSSKGAAVPVSVGEPESMGSLSEEEVVAALEAAGGNVTEAAQRLGRSRDAVNRAIKKYGIKVR